MTRNNCESGASIAVECALYVYLGLPKPAATLEYMYKHRAEPVPETSLASKVKEKRPAVLYS
jgi:hypothetical protein